MSMSHKGLLAARRPLAVTDLTKRAEVLRIKPGAATTERYLVMHFLGRSIVVAPPDAVFAQRVRRQVQGPRIFPILVVAA